jgi:hypothetical protein
VALNVSLLPKPTSAGSPLLPFESLANDRKRSLETTYDQVNDDGRNEEKNNR